MFLNESSSLIKCFCLVFFQCFGAGLFHSTCQDIHNMVSSFHMFPCQTLSSLRERPFFIQLSVSNCDPGASHASQGEEYLMNSKWMSEHIQNRLSPSYRHNIHLELKSDFNHIYLILSVVGCGQIICNFFTSNLRHL